MNQEGLHEVMMSECRSEQKQFGGLLVTPVRGNCSRNVARQERKETGQARKKGKQARLLKKHVGPGATI